MDDSNVNYKEMYLELMRATEKAINILIQAQRDCEEKYISFIRSHDAKKIKKHLETHIY